MRKSIWKSWESLNKIQQTNIIFTVVGFSVFVGLYLSGNVVSGFYFSMLTWIALATILDRVSRYDFESEVKATLEEMKRSVSMSAEHLNQILAQDKNLRLVGDNIDGAVYIENEIRDSIGVLNTIRRRSDEPTGYTARLLRETAFLQNGREAIEQGCEWVDILLDGSTKHIEEFRSKLSEDAKIRYKAYQFEGSIPVIQCMVIKYRRPRKSIVLFGWDYTDSHVSLVWISEDEDTVRFFEEYYKKIVSKSVLLA